MEPHVLFINFSFQNKRKYNILTIEEQRKIIHLQITSLSLMRLL
uniref:Uncharacterized protein n=1 Tax=Arundo donax TaxID=35708 RepID=A0A0A8Y665_ARUDO